MNLLKNLEFFFDKENKKSIYLSIFRVYIAFHILKKILFTLPYLDIIYGKNSFVSNKTLDFFDLLNLDFFREHNYHFIYLILVLSILFMFGIGKYFTCILLYISIEVLQRMNSYPLNGGDNLLKFILLYLTFSNCYSFFCMQNKPISRGLSNFLTNVSTYSIILHLCIIYFISAIHKAHSDVWFNGVATYYTLSIERFSGTRFNEYLTKNGYFVLISTYFTLFWELTFSFFVFRRKYRNIFILSGFVLHFSIYAFMMIHDFQILYISVYGLFYNNDDFIILKSKISIIINKIISKINYEKSPL